MCKSWCEAVLAMVLIVIGLWQLSMAAWVGVAWWIVIIVGVVLLFHSFTCKKCFNGEMTKMPAKKRR